MAKIFLAEELEVEFNKTKLHVAQNSFESASLEKSDATTHQLASQTGTFDDFSTSIEVVQHARLQVRRR